MFTIRSVFISNFLLLIIVNSEELYQAENIVMILFYFMFTS